MEKRTFDRKAVYVLRFSTTCIHKPWRADCRSRCAHADVPMAVQFEGEMSEIFQSTLGVKQGCPLSPTLFGIYIDDFQAELETAGGDLDLPTLCGVQAPALFYANDLDLVSTSVRGLQAQLELLESFCTRWRLTVNVKKTNACRSRWSPCMSHEALSGHTCKSSFLPRWWCMLRRLLHHRFLLTCVLRSKCWTRLHI